MTGFYQLRSPFTGTWLKIRAKDGEIVDGRATPWPDTRRAADLEFPRVVRFAGEPLICPIAGRIRPGALGRPAPLNQWMRQALERKGPHLSAARV